MALFRLLCVLALSAPSARPLESLDNAATTIGDSEDQRRIKLEEGLDHVNASDSLRNIAINNGRNCSMRKGGHTLPSGEWEEVGKCETDRAGRMVKGGIECFRFDRARVADIEPFFKIWTGLKRDVGSPYGDMYVAYEGSADDDVCGMGFQCVPIWAASSDDPSSVEEADWGMCLPCSNGQWCPTGTITRSFSIWENVCQAGTICEGPIRRSSCPDGTFCPEGSFIPGMLGETVCDIPGQLCVGSTKPLHFWCPGGYYCPSSTEYHVCPAGSYCWPASTTPRTCSWPMVCPEGTAGKKQTLFGTIFVAGVISLVFILAYAVRLMRFVTLRHRSIRMVADRITSILSAITAEGDESGDAHPDGDFTAFKAKPLASRLRFDFDDLGLTVATPSGNKRVLDGVTGHIDHSSVTAVLGPSGAGKTTFMNVLCDRARYGRQSGRVLINGAEDRMSNHTSMMGFVPQDDVVHEDLTVYENLKYSAELRLPTTVSREERGHVIEDVLTMLQINHVRDSIVGHPGRRGISGGQKKRVNIGLELVSDPTCLFLDEPTSGLDSTSSEVIMAALSRLSRLGMTIVTVIHQPRYSIFAGFDNVLLLGPGGMTVYAGSPNHALLYFEGRLGFKSNPGDNVADFLMDVISGREHHPIAADFKPDDLFVEWQEYLSEADGYKRDHFQPTEAELEQLRQKSKERRQQQLPKHGDGTAVDAPASLMTATSAVSAAASVVETTAIAAADALATEAAVTPGDRRDQPQLSHILTVGNPGGTPEGASPRPMLPPLYGNSGNNIGVTNLDTTSTHGISGKRRSLSNITRRTSESASAFSGNKHRRSRLHRDAGAQAPPQLAKTLPGWHRLLPSDVAALEDALVHAVEEERLVGGHAGHQTRVGSGGVEKGQGMEANAATAAFGVSGPVMHVDAEAVVLTTQVELSRFLHRIAMMVDSGRLARAQAKIVARFIMMQGDGETSVTKERVLRFVHEWDLVQNTLLSSHHLGEFDPEENRSDSEPQSHEVVVRNAARAFMNHARRQREQRVSSRREVLATMPGRLQRRPLPGAVLQTWIFMRRYSQKQYRAFGTFVVDCLTLLAGGLVCGVIIGPDFKVSSALVINYLMVVIVFGTLVCVNSLRAFGADKLIFFRESASGVSVLAFFIARNVVELLSLAIKPLLFVSVVYDFVQFNNSFAAMLELFLATAFAVSGLGYLISLLLPSKNSTLFTVGVSLIMGCFLSGALPYLKTLKEAVPPLQYWSTYASFGRYLLEGILVSELVTIPESFGGGALLDELGMGTMWGVGNDGSRMLIPDPEARRWGQPYRAVSLKLFAQGLSFRIVAYFAMGLLDRGKRNKPSLTMAFKNMLCIPSRYLVPHAMRNGALGYALRAVRDIHRRFFGNIHDEHFKTKHSHRYDRMVVTRAASKTTRALRLDVDGGSVEGAIKGGTSARIAPAL